MAAILLKSAENRILVGAIKSDIRSDLASRSGFIIDSLENRKYTAGEIVNFANEDWIVAKTSAETDASVFLILNRALTETEIVTAINKEKTNTEFFGSCTTSNDKSICTIRACRNYFGGEEYCYLYSSNTNLYRRPTWHPTTAQLNQDVYGYGQTIPSKIIEYWFTYHRGLQKALDNGKLAPMSFNDGFFNYPQTNQSSIYVRMLLSSEITNGASFASSLPKPFHLATVLSNGKQVYIYNASNQVQAVNSNTAAYILPVIEVYKG